MRRDLNKKKIEEKKIEVFPPQNFKEKLFPNQEFSGKEVVAEVISKTLYFQRFQVGEDSDEIMIPLLRTGKKQKKHIRIKSTYFEGKFIKQFSLDIVDFFTNSFVCDLIYDDLFSLFKEVEWDYLLLKVDNLKFKSLRQINPRLNEMKRNEKAFRLNVCLEDDNEIVWMYLLFRKDIGNGKNKEKSSENFRVKCFYKKKRKHTIEVPILKNMKLRMTSQNFVGKKRKNRPFEDDDEKRNDFSPPKKRQKTEEGGKNNESLTMKPCCISCPSSLSPSSHSSSSSSHSSSFTPPFQTFPQFPSFSPIRNYKENPTFPMLTHHQHQHHPMSFPSFSLHHYPHHHHHHQQQQQQSQQVLKKENEKSGHGHNNSNNSNNSGCNDNEKSYIPNFKELCKGLSDEDNEP